MSRRRRPVHPAEEALWRSVAANVAPLPGRQPLPPPEPVSNEPPAPLAIQNACESKAPQVSHPQQPPGFDVKLRRRLARGQTQIDARIDLHGMTQAHAHAALQRFIHRAVEHGHAVVLVITGKGGVGYSGAESEGRGVLRRLTPLWLKQPEFSPYIVAVQTAHASHGGEGALYLHLRRARKVLRP